MEEDRNSLRMLPFHTWKCRDTFRVIAGSVNISICSKKNNREREKIFLYQAQAGEEIPSYSYMDKSYTSWYFILEAGSEDASVECTGRKNGEALQRKFLDQTPAREYAASEAVGGEDLIQQSFSEWYQEKLLSREMPELSAAAVKKRSPEKNASQRPAQGRQNPVCLRPGEVFDTDRSTAVSLTVTGGKVQVHLLSRYGRELHRAVYLGTIQPGCRIPAFSYQDRSRTGWFFRISPVEKTAEWIPDAESADYEEFLSQCGREDLLEKFRETRDFPGALLDWYYTENIKPIPSDITPTQGGKAHQNSKLEENSNPLYRAVAYACQEGKISCLNKEELMIVCAGQEITAERIAEASHFICRRVVLEENWWESDCGILISTVDGVPVSCIPGNAGRYQIFYGDTGKKEKLTPPIAETVQPEACVLGRTLPGKKCSRRDIWNFCLKEIKGGDLTAVGLLALVGILISILIPTLNQKIYDDYIPLGNYSQLIQICVVIVSFMIGNMFLEMVKNLTEYRIGSKAAYNLQNAAIYRSFRLPEKFFRKFDSADLSNRILQLDEIVTAYTNAFVSGGFTTLFSLIYLYKMFRYSRKLAWIALGTLVAITAAFYVLSIQSARYEEKILKKKGEADSRLFQYLNAIDKIRLAGAENKAAQRYMRPVKEREKALIHQNRFSAFTGALKGVTVTVITMIFYYVLIKKKQTISIGNFTAFESAFGALAGALLSFTDGLVKIYLTRPNLSRVMPLFACEPEYSDRGGKIQYTPSEFVGRIELRDVSFRYGENMPLVLKNLNLTINPGEYVGIVGKSGCGKSTLFKLLLGFETAENGTILYDGNNLRDLDKKSFRQNLGVVLQNGRLINGSIYENITVTHPQSTLKEVRQVIKAVGLEDEIRQMPMGLQTMLNENCSTISGGQQQRILIARAIIGTPKILMFDEATSALDNLTQKKVRDSLDALQATRIVIAHRLSTIKNCDRIYVLDQGSIAEQGTYEELMQRRQLFYEMAKRQLVECDTENEY